MQSRLSTGLGRIIQWGITVLLALLLNSAVAGAQDLDVLTEPAPKKAGIEQSIFSFAEQMMRFFSFETPLEENALQSKYKYKKHIIEEDTERDFNINLSMGVDSEEQTALRVNSVRIDSRLQATLINTTYNYETDAVKVGVTDDRINRLIGDGLRVELVSDWSNGSGAIIFSMDL